ncbi:MAG TPA: hypothetical protein EYF98_10270 [Planctomycetes bacterium]|nr:hypothetical protein [Planctomycetota bacterium]
MEAQTTLAEINDTTRITSNRIGRISTAVFTLGLGLAAAAMAAPQEPEIAAGSYVRARDGAVVRNFRDEKGKAVHDLDAGSLLMVHSENSNYYEVSSPVGFPVWVFGKYLTETGTEGVLKANGNGVRMRPLPDSSLDSFPLTTRLNRGDLVQFIKRADSSRSFDADWIQVWSVPQAHGWISTTEVDAVNDQAVAGREWTDSLRGLVDVPVKWVAPAVVAKPDEEASTEQVPADSGKIPEEAYRSLAYGKTLLKGAMKKGSAAVETDFDSSIRAFDTVLGMVPETSIVAAEAQSKLMEAKAYQTSAATRASLATVEKRQEEMVAEWAEAKRREELRSTELMGRFMGRGWVRMTGRGDDARYFLYWDGTVQEISCESGRYNLDLFVGYELGVRGMIMRAASMATDDMPAEVSLLDVSRLEVISGSSTK